MPILHVRNVPEALYERLKDRADAQRRSLSAEVITLLAWAIDEVEQRPVRTLRSSKCDSYPQASDDVAAISKSRCSHACFYDLVSAAESSLDFWDNSLDDDDWSEAYGIGPAKRTCISLATTNRSAIWSP